MKDAARLLAYFLAVVLLGALLAPPLYWAGQSLAGHGILPFLAGFDFETFFHRALLLAALLLLWPLFQVIRVRSLTDLQLEPNRHWFRDLLAGLRFSIGPLLICGGLLIFAHVYAPRWSLNPRAALLLLGAASFVPFLEEALFRGLILGVLLRSGRQTLAVFITSAFYSIVHFLKAPEQTSTVVTWASGFRSIAHSFDQFTDPMLVAAMFTTLFVIGWVLADARLQTRSLWLGIGLHAGWIFGNGLFNRVAKRQLLLLPWLGKNLLTGLIPLGVCLVTWLFVRWWLARQQKKNAT